MNDVSAVLARLRQALGCASDAELSRVLGVRPGAVANWRNRGAVPASQLVAIATKHDLDLGWVTTGQAGEVREDQPPLFVTRTDHGQADPRLAAVLRWWREWWDTHDEEDRAWALVQLRRAIPEAGEFVRRALGDQDR